MRLIAKKAPANQGGAADQEPLLEKAQTPIASPPAHDESRTDAGSARDDDLSFGRCLHPGASELGYTHQDYCIVSGNRLASPDQLMKMLDVWDLKPPNLIVRIRSTMKDHPRRLVQPGMFAQDVLKVEIEKYDKTSTFMTDAGDGGNAEQRITEVLGDRLYDRMESMFMALLDACAETNSWILDVSSLGLTAVLLEKAFRRTRSRPVVLCMVDRTSSHYRSAAVETQKNLNTGKPYRPEQDKAWDALESGAKYLTSDADAEGLEVLKLPAELFSDQLWDVSNMSREDLANDDARSHSAGQWPNRTCSHYIFCQSKPALLFPMSWLGPMGTVFVSGAGDGEFGATEEILAAFMRGEPCILFKGTGRATDFWSLAFDAILIGQASTEEQVVKYITDRYPFWYDHTGDVFGNLGDLKQNMFRFVGKLLQTYQANPTQLRSSVVVVDCWKDTPELGLKRLSNCFQNSSSGTLELGASDADDAVVKDTWKHYIIIDTNAKSFKQWANAMTSASLILAFLSTVLAVLCTYTETQKDHTWAKSFMASSMWNGTDMLMVVFPACSGLVTTLLARLRYLPKWGALHVAMLRLESEIFKYRCRALDYDATAQIVPTESRKKKSKSQQSKDSPEVGGQMPNASRRLRDVFVTRAAGIFGDLLITELQQDALETPDDVSGMLAAKREAVIKDSTARYVEQRRSDGWAHQGKPGAKQAARSVSGDQLRLAEEGENKKEEEEVTPDDLISSMTTEEYIEHRTRPALERFTRLAPTLARQVTVFEFLIFASSLGGTLLGALKQKEFIPIAVAFSAMLASFLQYQSLQGRLSAANAGINDLSNLISRWHTFGVVEKRTRSVKAYIVDVTESAIIREAAAYAAGSGQGAVSTGRTHDTTRDKREQEGDGEKQQADGKSKSS